MLQRIGLRKHFIGITHYTLPAEITNAIDNLDRARSAIG
jgi:hypothetical protein